jgi:tRNA/tmRNA/rRNA uracil-C5-methylase (TrmA/RlmC/RlmD family)
VTSDTNPVVGDRITIEPVELVAGGAALARVNGYPIFVRSLYPGDVASVRIVEAKRGFARGEVLELLRPGPLRRTEPCPVAEQCGGCDWTALRLDHQLSAKKHILAESLRRVGKFEEIPSIVIHPSPLNYRLRSRLHAAANGDLGFFAERSNDVVPLPEECEVVGPAVIHSLAKLREHATAVTASFETFESEEGLAVGIAGAEGGLPVRIRVRDFAWELSTASFFQVNRHLLGPMLDLVTGHASRARTKNSALDLYSGVGFFSVPLARTFREVTAVESSALSHRYALRNAQGITGLRPVRDDVERFLRRQTQPVDFVFVDPPRAGLVAGVIDRIADLAGSICYLSCDPVTFSRDAYRLARRGWTLRSLDLLDLFPNTHHIETLCSFERDR